MSLSGIVTRNWRLKLAALTLAVLLWITMRLSDDRVSRLEIPAVAVRVDQVASDWRLQGEPSPSTVDITVTGPMRDLLRVAMAEPVVVVPLDSVPTEDLVLELAPDWVWNVDQSSVIVEDFAPSSVRLLFERYKVEDIPVTPRLIGRLPDSLALVAEPRTSLLFAQVRGPASEIDALQTVFLEPFDLRSVTESGRIEVAVDTTRMAGLDVTPRITTLLVEVATRESRAIGPVPIEIVGGGNDLVADPATVNITLSGASVVLDRSDPTDVVPSVFADSSETQRLAVEVHGLAPFLDAVAEPDSVTVRKTGSQ